VGKALSWLKGKDFRATWIGQLSPRVAKLHDKGTARTQTWMNMTMEVEKTMERQSEGSERLLYSKLDPYTTAWLYIFDTTTIHRLQNMLQDPMKLIGTSQLKQQLTALFSDSPIMINSPGRYLSH
jgi:hypothetical protein